MRCCVLVLGWAAPISANLLTEGGLCPTHQPRLASYPTTHIAQSSRFCDDRSGDQGARSEQAWPMPRMAQARFLVVHCTIWRAISLGGKDLSQLWSGCPGMLLGSEGRGASIIQHPQHTWERAISVWTEGASQKRQDPADREGDGWATEANCDEV
jgi:hypothetical protein